MSESVPTICARLGITRSSYYHRIRRGWPLEAVVTGTKGKHVMPRTATDQKPYRKSWDSWPMTEEQRAVNRVLREWRR